MSDQWILQCHDVHVNFPVANNWRGQPVAFAHALNGVSLDIVRGEVFGIVGESGCGKSTLAQVIMNLVEPSSGTIQRGLRGDSNKPVNIQIVFQDPQSSLDPRLPAWRVVTEPLVSLGKQNKHRYRKAELYARAQQLAAQVGLRPEHMDRYVHEFSGGQRQRIAIARALSPDPDMIVLDEPTSALDISVQAQILNLLQDLRKQHHLTYVLISHNVSVVRYLCDRVAVMYLGQIVEQGAVVDVLDRPEHPYTLELKKALPRLDRTWDKADHRIPAELPSNRELPQGCFFRTRCPWATTGCELTQKLAAKPEDPAHWLRCHVAMRGGIHTTRDKM